MARLIKEQLDDGSVVYGVHTGRNVSFPWASLFLPGLVASVFVILFCMTPYGLEPGPGLSGVANHIRGLFDLAMVYFIFVFPVYFRATYDGA